MTIGIKAEAFPMSLSCCRQAHCLPGEKEGTGSTGKNLGCKRSQE